MNFRITMTVSEAQLGGMLAKFNKGQLADIKLEPIPQVKTKDKPIRAPWKSKTLRGKPNSRICLGDTCHQVGGDASRAIVELLEKMEAEDGVGSITRKVLADEALRLDICKYPTDAIIAMLKAGHMVIVGED